MVFTSTRSISEHTKCSSSLTNSTRPFFSAWISTSLNLDNVIILKRRSSSDPINKGYAECNDCSSNLCDICNATVSFKVFDCFGV